VKKRGGEQRRPMSNAKKGKPFFQENSAKTRNGKKGLGGGGSDRGGFQQRGKKERLSLSPVKKTGGEKKRIIPRR